MGGELYDLSRSQIKPHGSFSSAKWEAITRHMREEADLSPEEQEAILEFLKSDN
jgi:hypothetical protein